MDKLPKVLVNESLDLNPSMLLGTPYSHFMKPLHWNSCEVKNLRLCCRFPPLDLILALTWDIFYEYLQISKIRLMDQLLMTVVIALSFIFNLIAISMVQ